MGQLLGFLDAWFRLLFWADSVGGKILKMALWLTAVLEFVGLPAASLLGPSSERTTGRVMMPWWQYVLDFPISTIVTGVAVLVVLCVAGGAAWVIRPRVKLVYDPSSSGLHLAYRFQMRSDGGFHQVGTCRIEIRNLSGKPAKNVQVSLERMWRLDSSVQPPSLSLPGLLPLRMMSRPVGEK